MKKQKYKLLRTGLFYDAIGMLSSVIPVVGPFMDIVWAPIAAKKMTQLYPGNKGKWMSVITFLEELLPFTDVVPTFTLMWFYTFVWKQQQAPDETILEAEVIS